MTISNTFVDAAFAAYAVSIKAADTAAEAADYAYALSSDDFVDDRAVSDAAYIAAYLKKEAAKAAADYAAALALAYP